MGSLNGVIGISGTLHLAFRFLFFILPSLHSIPLVLSEHMLRSYWIFLHFSSLALLSLHPGVILYYPVNPT